MAIVVAGLVAAMIRGDAPATVIVADGSVTPVVTSDDGAHVNADAPAGYSTVDPTAGDNLEVCDWDYCAVYAQLGNRAIERFVYEISLDEARLIADEVTVSLELGQVQVRSEVLDGELGGFYDPASQTVTLGEPIVAWTLLHELAHHVVHHEHGTSALSHGPEFLVALDELAGTP